MFVVINYFTCILYQKFIISHVLLCSFAYTQWLCVEFCSSFHVQTQSVSCLDSM